MSTTMDMVGLEAHLRALATDRADSIARGDFVPSMIRLAAEHAGFGDFAYVMNSVGNRRFLHDGFMGDVMSRMPGSLILDCEKFDFKRGRFQFEIKTATHEEDGTAVIINAGAPQGVHLLALVVPRDAETAEEARGLYLPAGEIQKWAGVRSNGGWVLNLTPARREAMEEQGILTDVPSAVAEAVITTRPTRRKR